MSLEIDERLREYIATHYIEEHMTLYSEPTAPKASISESKSFMAKKPRRKLFSKRVEVSDDFSGALFCEKSSRDIFADAMPREMAVPSLAENYDEAIEKLEQDIDERMKHLSDSYSDYLLFLIVQKGKENAEVYKKAAVDKKVFSKIKNNSDYHPNKLTALQLCIGLELSLDESVDLLSRAGYALSPSEKTDVIFSFFIENKIYDIIEIDLQLEKYGLPCIIE